MIMSKFIIALYHFDLDDMSDDELAFSNVHNSNIAIDPITSHEKQ